jgi:hypothetical protein
MGGRRWCRHKGKKAEARVRVSGAVVLLGAVGVSAARATAAAAAASREERARVRQASGKHKRWADETLLPAKPSPAGQRAGRMGQQSLAAETDRVLLRAYEHTNTLISSSPSPPRWLMTLRTPCPFPISCSIVLLSCSYHRRSSQRSRRVAFTTQTTPSCTQAGSSNFAPPTRSPIELSAQLYTRKVQNSKTAPGK